MKIYERPEIELIEFVMQEETTAADLIGGSANVEPVDPNNPPAWNNG